MKRLPLVLIATLLGSFAICGDAWQTYKSADGSYSASFPGKPMVKQGAQTMEGYRVPVEIATYGKGYKAYVIVRMDIGAVIPKARNHEAEMLNLGFTAFVEGKGYRVFSDESFQMNGHPGRHAVMHKNGVEEQFYAVGKNGQMIAIIVGGLPGKTVDQDANKFIASFRLSP